MTEGMKALLPVTPEEVENLRYVSAMLDRHGDKFPVPSHVPPKVALLRQLSEKLSHSLPGDVGMREALASILALIGNVDHSRGHGPNAAEMRGGMLNDIRDVATAALAPSALSGDAGEG